MRNALLAPELRELLQEGRHDDLRELLEDLHPNDAASILSGLETPEISEVTGLLPLALQLEVFNYFDPEVQEEIVLGSGRPRVRELLKAMPSDERYELLERLDERVRDALIPLVGQAARADLLARAQFEDDQCGAFLSTEYCALKKEMTISEAIAEVRRQAPKKETVYYAYVVDDDNVLIGFVSLRRLLMARDRQTVEDVMKPDPVTVRIDADQEEAANLIRDYDLLALPVVDEEGRLYGIVTYDDAADILEEENTEDIERMAGIAGEAEQEGGYVAESVASQIRRRVPLIAFLAVFNLTTALVIQHYEGALPATMFIAILPIVMATGGMVGTQASSLVIRGLTTGDVQTGELRSIVWKELRVSAGIGVVLSVIVFAEGLVLGTVKPADNLAVSLVLASATIALAMLAHVITAALFGACVPVIAKTMRRDPAMVSTPAVTALADLSGATIFCVLVILMFGAARG